MRSCREVAAVVRVFRLVSNFPDALCLAVRAAMRETANQRE